MEERAAAGLEQGICAVQAIAQACDAEVDVELFVVIVVVLGGRVDEREVVARVDEGGVDDGDEREDVKHQHVRSRGQGRKHRRPCVAEDVLERVAVDCREADGRGPLVVRLVDATVEGRMVQEAVRVVKEDLLGQDDHQQLSQALRERGHLPHVEHHPGLSGRKEEALERRDEGKQRHERHRPTNDRVERGYRQQRVNERRRQRGVERGLDLVLRDRREAVRVKVNEQQGEPQRKEQDAVESDAERDEEHKGVRERVRGGGDGGKVGAKARARAAPLAPDRHIGPHRRERVHPLRDVRAGRAVTRACLSVTKRPGTAAARADTGTRGKHPKVWDSAGKQRWVPHLGHSLVLRARRGPARHPGESGWSDCQPLPNLPLANCHWQL